MTTVLLALIPDFTLIFGARWCVRFLATRLSTTRLLARRCD